MNKLSELGEVKIGGIRCNISCEDISNVSGNAMGRLNMKRGKLLIQSNMSEENKELVILHEIIHAIGDMNGLELKENQVLSLESGLYQVLKDNDLIR